MATVNNETAIAIFKKNYSNEVIDAIPMEGLLFSQDIPFSSRGSVGDKFVQAVVLGQEVGITFAGSAIDVRDINNSIAGAVRQAEVSSYTTMLRSAIPFAAIARSQSGEAAFVEATKHVVKSNITSHRKFLEIVKIHGQNTTRLLGSVSYATATYRGVSLTAGAGTISVNGTNVTFATGGVNTTSKHILLAPGHFAAGIWVGMQGVRVKQLLASDLSVVGDGKLVSVDSEKGVIQVDFVPTAASAANSHILCFEGMEASNEMVGIAKILGNTGTLFNISASTFPLWKALQATPTSLGAAGKLTYDKLMTLVSNLINSSGISGKLKLYVNPRSFKSLVSVEAARRQYDQSYSPDIKNGGQSISFYYADGVLEVVGHRYMMEGDAFLLKLEDWVNSGVQQPAFTVKGMDQELIKIAENQTALIMTSYADQYIFCSAPSRQAIVTGIDDESAT